MPVRAAKSVAPPTGKTAAVQRAPITAGGGTALPAPVRQTMETALQHDFSTIRVHRGDEAPALGARAFARGDHLYFAPDAYHPGTTAGRRLIGHELAHVVQQRAGRVRATGGGAVRVNTDPALEREADRLGARAAAVPSFAAGGARAAAPARSAAGPGPAFARPTGAPAGATPGGVAQLSGAGDGDMLKALQGKRGLVVSDRLTELGLEVNRKPHGTGSAASSGSSRAARHDHGNQYATTGAKNKLVQVGGVSRTAFQSSQQRQGGGKVATEELREAKDLEKAASEKKASYHPAARDRAAKQARAKAADQDAAETRQRNAWRDAEKAAADRKHEMAAAAAAREPDQKAAMASSANSSGSSNSPAALAPPEPAASGSSMESAAAAPAAASAGRAAAKAPKSAGKVSSSPAALAAAEPAASGSAMESPAAAPAAASAAVGAPRSAGKSAERWKQKQEILKFETHFREKGALHEDDTYHKVVKKKLVPNDREAHAEIMKEG